MRALILVLATLEVAQATFGQQGFVITNQPVDQAVWAGGSATFVVGVSGVGPFTYQWQVNSNNLPNGIITTVAGNGTNIYFGDGGLATNASLNNPYGVVMDASGNVFIADSDNHRIRKVSRNGIITTVAGNGIQGYSGDGNAATNASFSYPYGVTLDTAGNLFIADRNNNRIRKVDTNGIITTVAGNGERGYSGDSVPAINTKLFFPCGVTVDDSGNLFIADTFNSRVRKVGTNGIISTFAGSGTFGYGGDGNAATNASLAHPWSVAFDDAGNAFIADAYNNRIRKVDSSGIITTVAGNGTNTCSGDGGAATNASLTYPSSVTMGTFGNLFIADSGNGCIRNVDSNGIITTLAGNGTNTYSGDGNASTNASLNNPYRLAVDRSGNLFIADTFNNRIRKAAPIQGPVLPLNYLASSDAGDYQLVVTGPEGSVTSSVANLAVGTITSQPATRVITAGTTATLSVVVAGLTPLTYQWLKNGVGLTDGGNVSGSAAATLTLGNVQSADAASYAVVVSNNVAGSVTSSTAVLLVITKPPASQVVLAGINLTLAPVSGTGPFTYQWQFNSTNLPNFITTVAGNGAQGYSGDGVLATTTSLAVPRGVVVDRSGNMFIADTSNMRIRKVDTNGIITTVAGNGTFGIPGDGGPATNATLGSPSDVFLDASGNLFIADASGRIRKVDTNGIITTVAGNGSAGFSGDGGPATNATLFNPQTLTVDSTGNLFIADTVNNRVRKVDTNGIITTVAGNGTQGYSGDGGAAVSAVMHYPWGVAVDTSGNLFIADNRNNRIRKVNTNGIITTIAGAGPATFSGDGGPATNATMAGPSSLVFDASGSLFFDDDGNNRIREVDTRGIITTVAGKGPNYPGNGSYSGDGGAATNANLNALGMTVDAFGNLFIADINNNRIRKVTNTHNPFLALNNLTVANAGNYQLVVTGPGGSFTNSGFNLTVLTVVTSPLIYQSAINPDGSFALSGVSLPNSTNIVFCATNLATAGTWTLISTNYVLTGRWVPIGTNFAGADGDWQFTDTNTAAYPTKFYRSLYAVPHGAFQ